MKRLISLAGATVLSGWAATAAALPVAQVDISGATFDPVTETVVTTSPTFTVYGYGNTPLGNGQVLDTSLRWKLSVAIDPTATGGTNFGSFDIGSTTYTTADFLYGTPPIESVLAFQSGDLSKHGVYPTLFMELDANWITSQTRAGVNVQDDPGTDPTADPGDDLYWLGWNFDISNLLAGFNLHFDLYGSQCHTTNGVENCVIKQFAPFSHDGGTSVPEPATLTLLGAGLLLLGATARRKRTAALS
jgi:hypothetical protein